MDTTVNRGYPFPECDPPRVKDSADMPGQLRDLAEAVDADLGVLSGVIGIATLAPAADMESSVAQVVSSGTTITFPTTVASRLITTATDSFTIQEAGLYLVTGSVIGTGNGSSHQLDVIVNGQVLTSSQMEPNPPRVGATIENAVFEMVILQPGDKVWLTQRLTGMVTMSYSSARLAAVRLVVLS